MKMKLLAACAVAGLMASPAMAQTTGAAAPAQPGCAAPPAQSSTSSMSATSATAKAPAAETGMATNTAATATDLKIGAAVTDSAGANLGMISKVGKGKDGDTMVTLKAKGKTKMIPVTSLSVSGGTLVSNQTKADIWGPH